jgi:hypothetical protein
MIWMMLLTAQAQEVLPLERVRFYEIGVAWFERGGRISESASLSLPTSHVDDALKSLVVLGGEAGIGAMVFPTRTDTEATEAHAGIQSSALDYRTGLRALVGEQVRVTGRTTLQGTLLHVSDELDTTEAGPQSAAPSEDRVPQMALTLLTDEGGVHRLSTTEVDAVEALDPAVAARIRAVAHTRSPTHPLRPAPLDIQAWKGGDVRVGYLAEAPVWRVTYRLERTASETRGELQGWALVHNDTGEDWDDVHVELSNGRPDSFLYPLAAPQYDERELRTPENHLSTVAQLATTTADELWEPAHGIGYGAGGLGMRGVGSGGSGFGSGFGTIGQASAALREAEGLQTPTQFLYRVTHPLDLPSRHSALVPILHRDLSAESAVVVLPDEATLRHGAWLRNDTGRTLPAGPVAVTSHGGLSGESALQRLEPDATQMIWFGTELDMDLERTSEVLEEAVTEVVWDPGRRGVVETRTRDTRHDFALENRSGRPRRVKLALALRSGARVDRDEDIDRQHGWTWVTFEAPTASSTHQVTVTTPTERTLGTDQVRVEHLESWAGLVADDVREDALALRHEIDGLREREGALTTDLADIETSLTSLRETLSTTGDAAPALARQVAQAEAKAAQLRGRRTDAERDRAEVEARLHDLLTQLAAP